MESKQSEQAKIYLQTALNALQAISPNDINEFRNLAMPPPTIYLIVQAIAILFRVISKADDMYWGSLKVILRPVPEFMNKLKMFHENHPQIEINVRNAALSALGSEMTETNVRNYGFACAPLFVWITNMLKYYEICDNRH